MTKKLIQAILKRHQDLIFSDGVFFVTPLITVSRFFSCEILSHGVRFQELMLPLFDRVGHPHMGFGARTDYSRLTLSFDDINRKEILEPFDRYVCERPRTPITVQDFIDTWGFMSAKVRDPRHLLTFATAEFILERNDRAIAVLNRIDELAADTVTKELAEQKRIIERGIEGDRKQALHVIDGWIDSMRTKILSSQTG